MPPEEEPFLAHLFPVDRVPMTTKVRGTVILASLRGIRARAHGDRYMAALEPKFHGDILALTAGTWLPMNLALAHYRACDALGLDRETTEAIGAEAGVLINETMLSVVARLSKESGVTPWTALASVQKLASRTWVGGSFAVWKRGPKEARLEWLQQPAAQFPYFRLAFGALTSGILGMFAQAMYVRTLPQKSPTEVSYRISWV